jgi:isoleucyl-tRNA synthetase
VLLPWYNAYRFFVMGALRYEDATGKAFAPIADITTTATNKMDRWLLASLQTLIKTVHVEIGENYKLYNVAPPLVGYLDQITNWYLRLNRDR